MIALKLYLQTKPLILHSSSYLFFISLDVPEKVSFTSFLTTIFIIYQVLLNQSYPIQFVFQPFSWEYHLLKIQNTAIFSPFHSAI